MIADIPETQHVQDYGYWIKSFEGGGVFRPESCQAGFYKTRSGAACAVSYEAGFPFVQINNRILRGDIEAQLEEIIIGFEAEIWPTCESIREADWRKAVETGKWDDHAPIATRRTNRVERAVKAEAMKVAAAEAAATSDGQPRPNEPPPETDPMMIIVKKIQDLVDTKADKILKAGPAKTKAEADLAANLAADFRELEKEAEDAREVATRPLKNAYDDERKRWKRPLELAAAWKDGLKSKVVNPWQLAENKRLAEERAKQVAAAQALGDQESAETIQAQKTNVTVGARGSRAKLVEVPRATITNIAEALAYFAALDEVPEIITNAVIDIAEGMAKHAPRGSVKIPGVTIEWVGVTR